MTGKLLVDSVGAIEWGDTLLTIMTVISQAFTRTFAQVLNLSLVGSYIILVVLLARLLLKKSPRWCSYLLWGIVFLRLILPVFPESEFSLIPAGFQTAYNVIESIEEDNEDSVLTENISQNMAVSGDPSDRTGNPAGEVSNVGDVAANNSSDVLHNSSGTIKTEGATADGMNTGNGNAGDIDSGNKNAGIVNTGDTNAKDVNAEDTDNGGSAAVVARILQGLSLVWAIGVISFGAYHIRSYHILKKQVQSAKPAEAGVYEIQGDHLSFVLGIFKPAIYLSGDLDEAGRKVVLCHEQVHLKRKDYLIKPAALAITCIHWFNPLVWVAFYLMSRDCEISCDEKVIAIMGEESKKVYSYALLDEATRGARHAYKRRNTCAVLSFGEDGIKKRIRHVLNFKKAPAWLLACTVVLLVGLILGLCSNSGNQSVNVNSNTDTQENVGTSGAEDTSDNELKDKNNGTDLNKTGSTGDEQNKEGTGKDLEDAEKDESTTEDPYNLTKFRNTPEAVLERWATAFTDKDGNVLYYLSHDKEAFEDWALIISNGEGYEVNMASSWPAQFSYQLQYEPGAEEATIRYWIVNNVPEIYPAYETVRLVQEDGLYYVDHVSFTEHNNISNMKQFEAAYGKDYHAAKEDGEAYSLASYEKTGYTKAFMRTIMQHIFYETDPAYYNAYKDPVTAAKNLLHLGEGSGEVTEHLYSALPGKLWSSGIGEGSVVMVSYTFAEDNSTIQIPMVLVDESLGVWGLSTGDLTGREEAEGVLPNDTYMTRNYVETVRDNKGNQYEFSDLGICALNVYGETMEDNRCIYPKYVLEPVPVWLWEDKLYFPTSSEYSDAANSYSGSIDWVYDSICEIDMMTGEYRYLPLPEEKVGETQWLQLNVHSGFIFINGGDGVALADAEAVWEGKTVFELTDAEKDAYGTYTRDYLLQHPGEVLRLGNRSPEQTTAIIDMNGDGGAEEISIIPDQTEAGHRYYTYDYYDLHMGDNVEEGIYANRLHNEIWAFSPDGEAIYIALYEEGPSWDPRTTFWGYEDDILTEAGTIGNEIERLQIQNGVISTTERRDIIQTDYIKLSYSFDHGKLVQVMEDTYDFVTLNDISLKKELTLHTAPDSEDTYQLQPQTVRFLKTDSGMTWVYLEAENGQSGWFQMTNFSTVYGQLSTAELFEGLYLAD